MMNDDKPPMPAWLRGTLFAAGWVFTAIGIAGLVLPLVPGVLFLILAAACFARSSPKFEAWLLNHPRLGPPILRWREEGSIPPRAKALACGGMALGAFAMTQTGAPTGVKVGVVAFLFGCAVYVLTRPNGTPL